MMKYLLPLVLAAYQPQPGVSSNTPNYTVKRNANGNFAANSVNQAATTTATAAGTTVLTVASAAIQEFTGSTTQNVVMPDATTVLIGHTFWIKNRSTGALTVKNNGGSTLATVAAGMDFQIFPTNVSTTNGTWDVSPAPFTPPVANSSLATMSANTVKANVTGGSATPTDVSILSTNTANAAVIRDGSGNFSAGTVTAAVTGTASGNLVMTPSNHGMLVSGTGNTLTVVAPDPSTTKVWTSGGSSADPGWQVAAGGGITALTGDGTASGTGSVALSVSKTGGVAFTNSATTTAASTNTASNIVLRDGSGNFSAGTVTATLSGQVIQPFAGGLTAAANDTQSGALALTANINRVTTSTSTNNSVILPTPSAGSSCTIEVTNVANTVHVFPAVGQTTNGQAANAEWPTGIVPATTASLINELECMGTSSTNWDCTLAIAGTGHISGSLTGGAAAAGEVGEVMTINLGRSSAHSLTSATGCNATATTCPATGGTQSIVLTPGDWDCTARVGFTPGATTSITSISIATSTTTNTLPGLTELASPVSSQMMSIWATAAEVPASDFSYALTPYQVLVNAGTTTTLFLVVQATFTLSTLTSWGSMQCRRMR